MNQLMVNTNGTTPQTPSSIVENVRKHLSFGIFALGAVFIFSSIQFAYADDNHNRHKRKKSHVKVNDQLIEVQGAILSLQDQIDALVSRVDTVEESVVANEVAVSTLTTQIQTMQALIDANLTDITAIQNEVAALQDQNTYLLSLIATNSGDIAALQAEFDANAAMVTTLEQAILLVQNNVIDLGTSLQSQIDVNITMVAALQSEIDTINADLALKQNAINGICTNGEAAIEIQANGSLVCAAVGGGTGGGTGGLEMLQIEELIAGVPIGQLRSIETPCPARFSATSNGFYHGLGWSINRLGVAQGTLDAGWLAARNDTGMTNFIYHVVTCINIPAPAP